MTTTTTNFTSANALQKVAYYYNSDYSKVSTFSSPLIEYVSKTPSDYYVQPGTTYMHNTYAPSVCLGTVAAGTHSLTFGIQSLYTSGAAVVLNGSFGTAPIQADSEVSVYSFS